MLGDDLAAELPNLRRHAESRMTETVRIVAGGEEVNEDTLATEFVVSDTVYDDIGRIRFPQTPNAEIDAAGQIAVKQDAVLSLPSGTAGIRPDMRAVIDASTADDALVGRTFRIKGFAAAGQTTATRFTVEETGDAIQEDS